MKNIFIASLHLNLGGQPIYDQVVDKDKEDVQFNDFPEFSGLVRTM